MNKLMIVSFMSLSLLNFPIYGSGIPVVDGAAIAQAVALVEKANAQIKELQDQVQTAKSQLDAYKQEVIDTKKRLEGFTDYSAIFGSAEAYMQDFWDDLNKDLNAADIRKFADKYGFNLKDYEQIEREYKNKFQQVEKYEALEKNITAHSRRLGGAQKAFNHAKTPQQREELLNNIILESNVLQAQIAQTNANIQKMEKEQKLKEEAAVKKYLDANFSL
ncbi:type IV secretion system protein [Arsenophonus nasoniae]|uniref:type IV secretion system protein n=1 Tax=Arsenophonus nasoniae TaxID=638 RepID=UPI003879269B